LEETSAAHELAPARADRSIDFSSQFAKFSPAGGGLAGLRNVLAMETRFEVCGRVTLSLLDADQRVRRALHSEMDPYPATSTHQGGADIVLAAAEAEEAGPFVDLQNPAGDGVVTAFDGRRHYLLHEGRWCSLADPLAGRPTRLEYQAGFPVWRVVASVLRPTLQIALLDHQAVAVHSAGVDVNGTGVIIGGWSESGKTETALAFVEGGARFISDKWTVVDSDGLMSAFPISVGVRRWVLRYLPRFRSALPTRARAQLQAAAIASVVSRPVRALRPRGRVGGLVIGAVDRAVALGDRAALRPSEVRAAYAQAGDSSWSAPLGAVVLLTTVPGEGVTAAAADPAWAARRLSRAAAFERRAFFGLHERSRYSLPDRDGDVEATIVEREERFLTKVFESRRLINVNAPFPTDPRRVAEAIARWL
jgi:hypothetical protein